MYQIYWYSEITRNDYLVINREALKCLESFPWQWLKLIQKLDIAEVLIKMYFRLCLFRSLNLKFTENEIILQIQSTTARLATFFSLSILFFSLQINQIETVINNHKLVIQYGAKIINLQKICSFYDRQRLTSFLQPRFKNQIWYDSGILLNEFLISRGHLSITSSPSYFFFFFLFYFGIKKTPSDRENLCAGADFCCQYIFAREGGFKKIIVLHHPFILNKVSKVERRKK